MQQGVLSVDSANVRTPDHHLRQQPSEWSRPVGQLSITEGAVGWVHTEGDRVLPNRPGKAHPTPLSRVSENIPSFLGHRAFQRPILTANYGFRDDMISSRYEAAAHQISRSLTGTAFGIDVSTQPENPARGLYPVSHFELGSGRVFDLSEPVTYSGPIESGEDFARYPPSERKLQRAADDYERDEIAFQTEVETQKNLNRLPVALTFGK